MAIIQINPYDYFYQWRQKTNLLATILGEIESINVDAGDRDTFVEAMNKVISNVGSLGTLTTDDKDSIVDAINELDGEHGALTSLKTTDKDSIVDAINEVFDSHLIGNAVITVGAESSNVIRASVQLKDGAGSNIAFRANVLSYLSNSVDGSTLLTAEHSGGWAIGNAGLMIPLTANKVARFTTNATGAFNVDITESGTKTAYLVVVLPNGKNVVSSAITHAA